ncbi:MAG TPA: tetratricopeptide repeat protein, partial [Opitutaceae bacterium]
FAPARVSPGAPPEPATEPPLPGDVASADELFLTGLHLEQYRHATRLPEDYWREALSRDPSDSRCNLALGRWHLRRGELEASERHLRASLARLTGRNPNPYDGESHYQLGRCLKARALGASPDPSALAGAYDAFSKAAWSGAWKGAAFLAMAEIDSLRGAWASALSLAEKSLRADADNLRAANLRAALLLRTGRPDEANAALAQTLGLDPLDWCARHLSGAPLGCDGQVLLDLALDYACAGLNEEALDVLSQGARRPGLLPDATLGTAPLFSYYRAWIHARRGDRRSARRHLAAAAAKSADYCFPARLEEIAILGFAVDSNPADAGARLCLGNLLYDRRRHREAIACWEAAAKIDPSRATVWRNLGIGYFNVLKKPGAAARAYDRALRADPRDARVLYERDQLWKRMGVPPARRLRELKRRLAPARSRDDLSVELCSLYNQTGRPAAALRLLRSRRFQPWEGGEGLALRQHSRAQMLLGRACLRMRRPGEAARHFEAALSAPENLGEAHHPLANQSEALYWLGRALSDGGDGPGARGAWEKAASARGDFQAMSVRSFSESTYYSAQSLLRLGRRPEARRLLLSLRRHAKILGRARAKIDYFATSLPTMLLFEDDLAARQRVNAAFLEAQALLGLGRRREGTRLLRGVLRQEPSHAWAADQPTGEERA